MNPEDFLYTLLACNCLLGNSSVGIRECAYLGVPSVNIGNRQAFRERGRNIIDVDYDRSAIVAAVSRQITNGRYARDDIYGDGTAGTKIADLLERVPLTIDKHLSYADLP
jgi:UDP-N-acetylglucosamine 2-epimerase